jgi:AcrR family transcriptional regulator
MSGSARQPSTRKDARRNREALLSAARELFAESGDVPMYEIGRRAGVGQATLYRHFPDRSAVMAAIFADELDALERLAARSDGDPNALFTILRAVAGVQLKFHGLVECVGAEPGAAAETARLKDRFAALVERPLRDARKAGTVRRDLGLADVFLVIAMVAAAIEREGSAPARAAAGDRALALLFDGLR